MYTYRDLIRRYSADVMAGSADTDLTARQRKYAGILLNLASNHDTATVAYPPDPATRERIVRALGEIVWTGSHRSFLTDGQSADFDAGMERAFNILRAI